LRASPTGGTTGVPLNTWYEFEFSEALDPTTVPETVTLLNFYAPPVTGTVSLVGDRVVRVVLDTLLTADTPYYFYSLGGLHDLKDLQGQPVLLSPTSWTTGADTDTQAPAVVTVSPSNGS